MQCAHCDSNIPTTRILFQYRSGIHCRLCGKDSYVAEGEIQRIVAAPPVRAALMLLVVAIFLLAVLRVHGLLLEVTILLGVLFVHVVRQWSLNSAKTARSQSELQIKKERNGRWFVLLIVPIVVIIGIQEVRPFLPPQFAMVPMAIGGLILVWFFRANRAIGSVNQ